MGLLFPENRLILQTIQINNAFVYQSTQKYNNKINNNEKDSDDACSRPLLRYDNNDADIV